MRALGYGTDAQIVDLLGEEERLLNTLEKDTTKTTEEGLIEIYKRQRPGEPPTEESARSLLYALFFDAKRYDLARVGRYKFNKKLSLASRIAGYPCAENAVHPVTGELLKAEGELISREDAKLIQNAGVNAVYIAVAGKKLKVVGNRFVEAAGYLSFDPELAGINEKVHHPTLMRLLKEGEALGEDGLKALLRANVNELVPRHILPDDIIASVSYLMGMPYGVGRTDDIDHLGNRRIRA